MPSSLTPCVQEGEAALGFSHLVMCIGKSYSGPIRLTPEIEVKAYHFNARHSGLEYGWQITVWIITYASPAIHEDIELLIRERISKIYSLGSVPREYEALQLCLAPLKLRT